MSFITKFSLDTNRLTVVFIAAIVLIGLIQFFDCLLYTSDAADDSVLV